MYVLSNDNFLVQTNIDVFSEWLANIVLKCFLKTMTIFSTNIDISG